MQYYDYRPYFQTLINNQESIISRQTLIFNFLTLFIFIFVCFFLYIYIRNMIKTGGNSL